MLEGAALAFADEAQGDHQNRHDLEENRDQAGDKEVGGACSRVVEHGGSYLDGHGAVGQHAAEGLLERDAGGGAHGLAGDAGVRSVDQHEDGCGGAVLQATRVVVGNADADAGFAAADGFVHLVLRLGVRASD